MIDNNFRQGDAKSDAFGTNAMLNPAPEQKIPDGPTIPTVAYQMVKDETFAQTQPRLNLASSPWRTPPAPSRNSSIASPRP